MNIYGKVERTLESKQLIGVVEVVREVQIHHHTVKDSHVKIRTILILRKLQNMSKGNTLILKTIQNWVDRLALKKVKDERETNRDKVEMKRSIRLEEIQKRRLKLDTDRLQLDKSRMELEAEEWRAGIDERKQSTIAFPEIAGKFM